MWGHTPTREAPHNVSRGADVNTERRVQGARVVMAASGLVHHRSGAISCNIYQLTQGTLG